MLGSIQKTYHSTFGPSQTPPPISHHSYILVHPPPNSLAWEYNLRLYLHHILVHFVAFSKKNHILRVSFFHTFAWLTAADPPSPMDEWYDFWIAPYSLRVGSRLCKKLNRVKGKFLGFFRKHPSFPKNDILITKGTIF